MSKKPETWVQRQLLYPKASLVLEEKVNYLKKRLDTFVAAAKCSFFMGLIVIFCAIITPENMIKSVFVFAFIVFFIQGGLYLLLKQEGYKED